MRFPYLPGFQRKMPDCWKQNILCSNVNSDQPWKSVRVRHPGAFVTRYLDKLFTSSSSVGKSDSITIPRSVMCWVSTTGKSRCLRAPWAHIPNFPLCQKWYEKRLHHVTCHSFLFVKSLPFPHPSLWNPLTLLACFPEAVLKFIKEGEYWFGVIWSALP